MNRVKLTAIVLRAVDYGESDRVITLFSRERGKVSAFARGARASRRRFGGALEPFTLVTAEARERSGSDLLGLDAVTPVRAFGGIRGDLARIACAGYAVELARELVREHEPHDELFRLLETYLGELDAAPARPWGLRAFEMGALGAAGFLPRVDACARCGADLPPGDALRFDPPKGGVLCDRCAAFAAPGWLGLSGDTRAALLGLQAAPGAGDPVVGQAREAREALTRFIEHVLGRPLPSRKFLDEIGPALGG
ncbi:MAG TPA: DNA repair protein RecO [Anaeromyxobacteraceae bacterium]|nr:DNA repair protein RecO [Anaeromyxobacteraceae bacterium]